MLTKSETIKAISEFIFVEDEVIKSDLIIVPGSSFPQLPKKAARLYNEGLAKKIVFTGGYNPKIEGMEAEWASATAIKENVPIEFVLIESKSQNTKENALNVLHLIKANKLPYKKILLVSKTYHARRLKMTFSKVFFNSTISVVPVEDGRKINKNNWWKDKTKTARIMEEIKKIGEYYLKGDLSLRE